MSSAITGRYGVAQVLKVKARHIFSATNVLAGMSLLYLSQSGTHCSTAVTVLPVGAATAKGHVFIVGLLPVTVGCRTFELNVIQLRRVVSLQNQYAS